MAEASSCCQQRLGLKPYATSATSAFAFFATGLAAGAVSPAIALRIFFIAATFRDVVADADLHMGYRSTYRGQLILDVYSG